MDYEIIRSGYLQPRVSWHPYCERDIRKLDHSKVWCGNKTYHSGGPTSRKTQSKNEKNNKTRPDDSGECHREASNADAHSGGCGNGTPSRIPNDRRRVYSRYARGKCLGPSSGRWWHGDLCGSLGATHWHGS